MMIKVAKDLLEPTGGIIDMLAGSQLHRENRDNILKNNKKTTLGIWKF